MLTSTSMLTKTLRMTPEASASCYTDPTYPLNMFCTYEDSVLDAADENGNLSYADACKLFADHGESFDAVYEDNHGVSWAALDERNAEALLAWLGY
jgi:hypothetical protein